MAGGLFAVYRDTTVAAPIPAASRRSNGTSSNLGTNKAKKDGFAVFRDHKAGVNGFVEKENVDPLDKGGKKGLSSGKGKKVNLAGGKPGDCRGPAKGVMGERIVKKVAKPEAAPTNGICTGTLRTRVLPPLPPLESEPAAVSPLPPVVDSPRTQSPSRVHRSERLADSPASNVDSGYGKLSDTELDLEREIDLNDESDMSIELEEISTRESNHRARALTESPLAEITQAFTGMGGFSNAPASPSPSQAILNRPSLLRKRSSPSKSVSALPPRLRPYSTTATTKKIKPGQTTAEAPKGPPLASSSRSLRF